MNDDEGLPRLGMSKEDDDIVELIRVPARMGNNEYGSERGEKEHLGRYIHSGIQALAETPQMEAPS